MITHDQVVHFAAHFGMSFSLFFVIMSLFAAMRIRGEFDWLCAYVAFLIGLFYKLIEVGNVLPTVSADPAILIIPIAFNLVGLAAALISNEILKQNVQR